MDLLAGAAGREAALAALFESVFAASEGAEEGRLVGGLARDLLARTPHADIRPFAAVEDGRPVAAALFTRLAYPEDTQVVFLLSPMAVATARQRRGVGRALILHALGALRAEGVHVAMTYGDPAYYARAGFLPVPEARARPPLPLSQPHGWLGRSLTDAPMPPIRGPSRCVPALDRAEFW